MCSRYFIKIILIIILLAVSQFSFADDAIIDHNVSISATVNSSGGGGGGGGGDPISIPATVNFSGKAHPMSTIYILKDGRIAVTTIADPGANFYVSLTGLSTDTYNFTVYAEDFKGRKSASFSFPVYVTSGTTVNIGNIFLSPTIDIDKTEVKRGDNLIIFGQSAPNSEVTISIHSLEEFFFKTPSNSFGAYLYNLDTSILEYGDHQTKSKVALLSEISSYTNPLPFIVGDVNKEKEEVFCSLLIGDLNCDNRVNLVDFSIMAYWYKKSNFPKKVDLNKDLRVNLIDFSIMAYHWTG